MESMSIPYILQCTIQYNALCYKVFISLLRGFHALSFPEFRRWSSWSPSRLTFGCFDSMEVKSRFALKMAFWILTKNIYYTLSTVA